MTTRYVNTASSAGGDGTTNNTSGSTRAFASLREALDSLPGTLTDAVTIYCTGSAADTLSCTQSNFDFVTSATNYLLIQGENRTGKWDTSKYRIEVTDGDCLYTNIPAHMRWDALQAKVTATTSIGNDYLCYRICSANVNHAAVDLRISNCIAWMTRSGTDHISGHQHDAPTGGGSVRVWNCVSYGGYYGFVTGWVNCTHYNCTAYGNQINYNDAGSGPFINCLSAAPVLGDGFGFLTGSTGHSNNASDESSAKGTNSRINQTFTFVNTGAGTEDFHLQSSDVGARMRGLTNPASGVFLDDIDGTTRTGRWDIGADQVPVTVALTGTATSSINEGDIVTGGKTVILTVTNDTFNVSTGTPTFSTATSASTTTAPGRQADGTLDVSWPTGYAPNNLDFAIILLYNDQGTGSVPTNWSEVTGSPFGSNTPKLQIFYKVLDGTETTPQTTISGSTGTLAVVAGMLIYTGVGGIGAIGTASAGTGTPMTAGAITTTQNNSIVLGCCGRGDNETSSGQTFGGSSTGVNERLDAGSASGDDAQVSAYDKTFPTSGTSSGNGSATTSATDPWVSVLIELIPSTPFTSARSAIASGLDSAQSEATGWDAKVKPNIPVANVVRTSNTVCTITLQAQSDYNITAQETITAILPASALAGGGSITASPTFTIDFTSASFLAKLPTMINQSLKRSTYW